MTNATSEGPASTLNLPRAPLRAGIRALLLGCVVVVALAGGAWALLKPAVKRERAGAVPLVVEGETVRVPEGASQWQYLAVSAAVDGPPLEPLPVPGRVEIDESRSASVGAPLAGRVERVLVRFGDHVTRGQRLLSVRSAAFADLDRELSSAREEVAVKKRVVERISDLVKLQAAPEKELLASQAELKETELTLKAAQAKQSSLSVSAEGDNLFWVTAPSDGTVVELEVFASQEVGPDREKPLVRISNLSEVIVIGDVAERDATDLKAGGAAQIRTEQGRSPRVGVIERVSEVVDPRRHTVEIRTRVKNDDRTLRPNAYVDVTFAGDTSTRSVRVPTEAVVTEGDRTVVFVKGDGGAMVQTPIVPGRTRDGLVEVREGLAVGTPYVSKGALLLLNQIDLAK